MPWEPDAETTLAIRSESHLKVRFIQQIHCDPVSPIKIKFDGTPDASQTAGTISLNNANDSNTAKGYGIQVKYQNQPIELGILITVSENNNSGNFSIPLEAGYIQTSETTTAGKADGTLQFTLQYH